MTDPPLPAYYIATVWFADAEDEVGSKQLVRMRAYNEENFKQQIRGSWPFKVITFGPVSLSKVQE